MRGNPFWGTMFFSDKSLYNEFRTFARTVTRGGILRVGNNLTRGLGKLGVPQIREFSNDDIESFKERVNKFNKKLHTEAQVHCIDLPHGFYFPITFQSDVILSNLQLRYQTVLNSDYLHHIGNLSDITLVYQNAGLRCISGWNALFGLPKAAEWAISMGSVFLFGCNGTIDDCFYKKLYALEQTGIGKRKSEGFGQLTVADAFHCEVNEYESKNENS